MVLTSHHPLLAVIKHPVIRMGIYRCSETDGSESVGTVQQHGATPEEKCKREIHCGEKEAVYKCLSVSIIHKPLRQRKHFTSCGTEGARSQGSGSEATLATSCSLQRRQVGDYMKAFNTYISTDTVV